MKFQKSIIAFAVATAMMGTAGAAFAGTASSTYNTYAIEALPSLTAVVPSANAYQTGILIANGTKFTMFLQLAGGAKWDTAYAKADVAIVGASTDAVAISSADPTVMVINFTATANIASGTVMSFAAASSAKVNLSGVSATGSVTESYAITNGTAAATSGFPTAGVLDSATGTVASIAEALSGAIVPSNSFPIAKTSFIPALGADFGVSEKGMIDVGAATPFTLFTGVTNGASTTVINLGAFYINNVPGNQLDDAGVDYTVNGVANDGVGANTNDVTATMTGSFPKGATFKVVSNDNTCLGAAVGTATLNAGLDSVAIKLGGAAKSANAYSICMTVDSKTAIPVTTPQLTAFKVVDNAAANTSYTLPTTGLYPLVQNGSSVRLMNYVPAAIESSMGYTTYVVVNNASALAAPVRATLTDNTTGSVLGSGVVGTMNAGTSMTLTATQIEAALAITVPAAARPVLVLSAAVPAGQLKAQIYQQAPGSALIQNQTSYNTQN